MLANNSDGVETNDVAVWKCLANGFDCPAVGIWLPVGGHYDRPIEYEKICIGCGQPVGAIVYRFGYWQAQTSVRLAVECPEGFHLGIEKGEVGVVRV